MYKYHIRLNTNKPELKREFYKRLSEIIVKDKFFVELKKRYKLTADEIAMIIEILHKVQNDFIKALNDNSLAVTNEILQEHNEEIATTLLESERWNEVKKSLLEAKIKGEREEYLPNVPSKKLSSKKRSRDASQLSSDKKPPSTYTPDAHEVRIQKKSK